MRTCVLTGLAVALLPFTATAEPNNCDSLPGHATLRAALVGVVDGGGNVGLANDMWATIVDRDGIVCVVAFSGPDRFAQWGASRVISAQKANTANSLSLSVGDGGISGLALSTGNLWAAVQPGGSLFGLQHSNPVDTSVAYAGPALNFGKPNDPMVGRRIGGVNVFGGGLALYDAAGERVGGIGLSGDTSCSDHIQAWKVRDALGLDFVPAGVSATGDDNIILDPTNAFGHPECLGGEAGTSDALPANFPVGPNP